jgi:fructose-1,6-bisphosphatase/inositol monophosphatase family enzyme
VRHAIYTATSGEGAWLRTGLQSEPERLSCNDGVPMSDALVATGFSYQASQRAVQGGIVARLLPKVRDIRRAGSAALDLCSLASGRVDAYYESGMHLWDIAAGGLIAREAGAVVAVQDENRAGEDMTIGASPSLFLELRDTLAELAGQGR